MSPRVSIVITCFNQGRFLDEAIRSAQSQTCPAFDIVVIDDGSGDETALVAARHPRVRYVYQRNQGLSAARNAGVRASRGDYLVFLDADDRLLPNALEAGLAHFAACPDSAVVAGGYTFIRQDGSPLPGAPARVPAADPYEALLRGNFIAMHAAVMYRRELFTSGLRFATALSACEDYQLYLQAARTARISIHAARVAEYRQHGDGMTQDAERMLRSALAVLGAERVHARRRGLYPAWRHGVREFKRYYGGRLAREAGGSFRNRQYRQAARAVLAMLRWCPAVLLRHAVEAVTKRRQRLTARTVTTSGK